MNGKYVSYLRVSTDRQGRSGLGLEAQRKAVTDYLNGGTWELVAEFVEVESGKKSDRPELHKALSTCRIHSATLVVAKLDRLARNAFFLLGLKEAGVDLVCCDMPFANRLTIGIMAMVAEEEGRMISARTKAALAAAKVRGVKLGRPNLKMKDIRNGNRASATARTMRAVERANDLRPLLDDLRGSGCQSPLDITRELNARKVPAPRGGRWTVTQTQRLLLRAVLAGHPASIRPDEV